MDIDAIRATLARYQRPEHRGNVTAQAYVRDVGAFLAEHDARIAARDAMFARLDALCPEADEELPHVELTADDIRALLSDE